MRHPDEFRRVVAAARCLIDYLGEGSLGKERRAGEDPEIFVAAGTYEGIGIVGAEHQHAVVGIEGAPERHAQEARRIRKLGLAFALARLAVLEATVEDAHLAVGTERIPGRAMREAALKTVIVTRHFVPRTEVLLKVKVFHRGVIHGIGAGT